VILVALEGRNVMGVGRPVRSVNSTILLAITGARTLRRLQSIFSPQCPNIKSASDSVHIDRRLIFLQ
jgi:hypothetical protein